MLSRQLPARQAARTNTGSEWAVGREIMKKKNIKQIWTLLCAALVLPMLLFTTGCSPTTEGESRTWKQKNAAASEYATRWSGFKKVIDGQVTAATAIWKKAEAISDKKKKAAKMKEANVLLAKLVDQLDKVKSDSEEIEKIIEKLNELPLSESKDETRERKTDAAHKALNKVEEAMSAAEPADLAQAQEILSQQISTLSEARRNISRAYNSLSGGQRKKKRRKKKRRRSKR